MPTAPPEVRIVDAWRVACDGGEGVLGHPRVWLCLSRKTGQAECPYCDALLIHRDAAKGASDRLPAQAD